MSTEKAIMLSEFTSATKLYNSYEEVWGIKLRTPSHGEIVELLLSGSEMEKLHELLGEVIDGGIAEEPTYKLPPPTCEGYGDIPITEDDQAAYDRTVGLFYPQSENERQQRLQRGEW